MLCHSRKPVQACETRNKAVAHENSLPAKTGSYSGLTISDSRGRHTFFVNGQTINCTAWPPPSNVETTSVADCELLSTCHRESAGCMYRKSTFLSACTLSCQQIGVDLNRLKLPRDCRIACEYASCLSGLQTRLQALHAALRACFLSICHALIACCHCCAISVHTATTIYP